MGNVLIEETSLDSVGDAIREQLDVSTKYKVSEMPDAIRSISGGGGGTTNYNNLSNKPQINSVTLEGNKSLSDLSIQETLTFDSTPTDGSTNPVTSDGIYDAFAGVDTALSGKVDTTSVGVANGIAELDNDGLVPSSQLPDVAYTDVTNKPSINSVTLSGNKTAADLGLVNNTDLTDIIATGPTNATGNTITSGVYFYLDGVLCKAKSDIASGATFTLNTNYEVVTAGGLNSLNSALTDIEDISSQVSYDHTRIPTLWGLSVKKKNGICYIYMSYAMFNAAANNVTLLTGLPKCAQQTNGGMTGADAGQTAAISAGGSVSWIATGGTTLMAHIGPDYGRAHWISVAYPIDES